jgi:hypothetical protein
VHSWLVFRFGHQQRVEREGTLPVVQDHQRVDVDLADALRMPRGERDSAATARAAAATSAFGRPRAPSSSAKALSERSICIACASVTGATCSATSRSTSAKMPPRPTITTGPKTGSFVVPRISSVPPCAICATSTPAMRARGAFCATRASMASYASRSCASERTPTTTPPTSVLCAMSGETIFSTSGNPMSRAAASASFQPVAVTSLSTGMPACASTALALASLAKASGGSASGEGDAVAACTCSPRVPRRTSAASVAHAASMVSTVGRPISLSCAMVSRGALQHSRMSRDGCARRTSSSAAMYTSRSRGIWKA